MNLHIRFSFESKEMKVIEKNSLFSLCCLRSESKDFKLGKL